MTFRLSSLRVRLVLLVLLAVVPASGLILWTAIEHRQADAELVQQNMLRLADGVALNARQFINQAYRLLAILEEDPEVQKHDVAQLGPFFSDLLQRWPSYANLGLVGLNGEVLASALPSSTTVDVSDRSYFLETIRNRDFAMGDYQIGQISHKPIVPFGYPVTDNAGKITGVLFAAIDVTRLNQLDREMQAQLTTGTTLAAIDSSGTVLVYWPNPEKWVGRTVADHPLVKTAWAKGRGMEEAPGLDGIRRFHAFQPLQSRLGRKSVNIIIGTPREVAFAKANQLLARNLSLFGLVAVLALVVAWFGADLFILRRVNPLLRATERLSRGDLGARTGIPPEPGEMTQLAQTFDQMAEALEQREGERKEAEEALKRSEQEKALILESIPEQVLYHDKEMRILWANSAAAESARRTPGELVGHYCYQLYMRRSEPCEGCPVVESLQAGEPRQAEMSFPGGPTLFIRGYPVRDAAGEIAGAVEIALDVSARRQLEDQLRQAQRLQAVGKLAGGVAHDFNNLLTAIIGYSDLLMSRLGGDSPLRKDVLEIRKAGERATTLTRQLLAFSRRQVLQPKVLNLNSVVAEMHQMLCRLIGEDVDLVTVLVPGLGRVKADPGQIEQIIMNLVVNARDAMPHGGKLTIETANVDLDDAYVRQHAGVQPGPYALLAISDTGLGMDSETQSQVFEPFFTTKEKGQGAGLGLATVYGIVKQSGGHIWVYSEPGRGTTFKIYLPRVEEPLGLPESTAVRAGATEGTETILVVEDEDEVRWLVCEILQEKGYSVLEVRQSREAVELGQRYEGPIHLLVTDVVMPGMGGRELAENMTRLRPAMKVLYISGYTENAIVHQGVLDEGTHFLPKPFPPEVLARKVRDMLDESREE